MSSPHKVPIYTHNNPLQSIAPLLSAHLPLTLCLLRRIQFHAQSPDAHVYATFPPDHQPASDQLPGGEQIWTVAFVDRSRVPETECWLFSSVEILAAAAAAAAAPNSSTKPDDDDGSGRDGTSLTGTQTQEAKQQLITLFDTIRAMGVPDSFAEQAGDQPAHILVAGCVQEVTLSVLTSVSTADLRARKVDAESDLAPAPSPTREQSGNSNGDEGLGIVYGYSIPWLKFLYSIDITASALREQEEKSQRLVSSLDLQWTTVQAEEFSLVRSRTTIPRRDRTLILLPSVGLREKSGGKLIAWAFLGVDGGLTSLHVEDEYRGKGLGKAVAGRVLGLLGAGIVDGKGFYGLDAEVEKGFVCSYSHTALHNLGSIGVAKGLGGRQVGVEYWVVVDLNSIESSRDGL